MEQINCFLALNKIADGIMRKDSISVELINLEMDRNKKLSKTRYIVEQYFGISYLNERAKKARFTTTVKARLIAGTDRRQFSCWLREVLHIAINSFRHHQVGALMT